MNQFCQMKGIKREFSVARTPQQNGVAERKNRTLIEATRTMLVDLLLPATFWAEALNTAWQAGQAKASDHEYILLPFMPSLSTQMSDDNDADEVPGKGDEDVSKGSRVDDQERIDINT
nr:putative ribonuclease H-like domain-containing protein [Tanacetum cinerariifolium]